MILYQRAPEEDFEAIHRLNYETFVEEIPQHKQNAERRLVDKFHHENTYWIGKKNGEVVAMCALRGKHPFSLEQKGVSLPEGDWIEVRLLAVKPEYRNTRTFAGLMRAILFEADEQGFNGVLISGTTREQKLYSRFGFVPFSEAIGPEEARYIPMQLTREVFEQSSVEKALRPRLLLAGSVELSDAVFQALSSPLRPHRSKRVRDLLCSIEERLKRLTGMPHMYTLLGSGTVANDAAAGQLKGKGLVVEVGHFGKRLVDHAKRKKLQFDVLTVKPGQDIDWASVSVEQFDWIWLVHCETSTGVLYDLEPLYVLKKTHGFVLAIDAISAVGTVNHTYEADFVTFVSGKALRGVTGLAFVGTSCLAKENEDIARYLDLSLYTPMAFSQAYPLLRVMDAALTEMTNEQIESHQEKLAALLEVFDKAGITLDAERSIQAPGIVSIQLPKHISSKECGNTLYFQGYEIQYESSYLVKENKIQLSTMGWTTHTELRRAARCVSEWIKQKQVTPV